ncbi:MAG: GNAT family N-acetyltransferase [Alphaproteobacteria bacterium]|nr:GNAT family N-acetyltransferase [Alphaproteobacteria bacterium]
MSPLDRPVWSSLATAHRHISLGDDAARRYLPDVNVFASPGAGGRAASARLAALVRPGERIFMLQAAPIEPPAGLRLVQASLGVQMLAQCEAMHVDGPEEIVRIGEDDAADMLALAALAKPGPLLRRTHVMGGFVGIRVGGRLVAMAGERMRFPGFVEISGVCTHPEFRGRGLARRLSLHVAAAIRHRGDRPFLHAWKTNTPAIRLYQRLGFRHRCDVHVAVLETCDPA